MQGYRPRNKRSRDPALTARSRPVKESRDYVLKYADEGFSGELISDNKMMFITLLYILSLFLLIETLVK